MYPSCNSKADCFFITNTFYLIYSMKHKIRNAEEHTVHPFLYNNSGLQSFKMIKKRKNVIKAGRRTCVLDSLLCSEVMLQQTAFLTNRLKFKFTESIPLLCNLIHTSVYSNLPWCNWSHENQCYLSSMSSNTVQCIFKSECA